MTAPIQRPSLQRTIQDLQKRIRNLEAVPFEVTDGSIDIRPVRELLIGSGITLTNPSTGVAEITSSGGGGSGIQFGGTGQVYGDDNSGEYLHVETDAIDSDGRGMVFRDTAFGGIEFFTTGYSADGGGVYIEGDDATNHGTPIALDIRMKETASGTAHPIGIQVNADGTTSTVGGTGILATADGRANGSAFAISAQGTIDAGTTGGTSGNTQAAGIIAEGFVNKTGANGDAVGGKLIGTSTGGGRAVGVLAQGLGTSAGTGDIIGGVLTATQAVGGSATQYGLQVFIENAPASPVLVFQINADGSLHGLTGQSLTFDL